MKESKQVDKKEMALKDLMMPKKKKEDEKEDEKVEVEIEIVSILPLKKEKKG